ncbi:YesL family protein [Butyrivibrio proteoclasticus]|uniref:YesL family protein n=1 Tax=Butyrivibrio proteoclasticus TaxID=43305 RepID=UPI0009DE2196|nr:YesL family protein [Butyrivibrio proteoclasticus]
MFKGLFSPDNPVIRFTIKLGYIWWLNILWLLSSLPIITIGASSTALIYSCMKLHKDEGYPTANFFKSFRENLRQSTILWCIYLVVGLILGADIIFWNHQGKENRIVWGIMIAVGILYSISLSYVFAIQSKFNNSIKRTVAYSVIVPFHNMKETLLILVTLMAVVFFNVTSIFMVNFFTLNLGVGLIAYLLSVFYMAVFERYIPQKEPDKTDI